MQSQGSPTALGTGNIRKLLLQYAIPSVIAMTASSLYNITDSIFIGHGVGPMAISGLAITFPLMNLAAAFGSLVGGGASSLMSLRLGQRDYAAANAILGNVFTLNLTIGAIYTILVLLFLDPILFYFGASRDTLPYAHDFMLIITLGNVVTHLYLGSNVLLRASGNPKKSMYNVISTVVLNVILAPLFIYGFKWGISGAALATVLSQTIMLATQIRFFTDKRNFIHLQKGAFRLKRRIVVDSLSIGMAPFMMNAAAFIVIIVINHSLIKHGGDLAVGAYGIINRFASLFPMIILGLNQGMQPIAGYNFGAKQYDRVNSVLMQTILWATGVMLVAFLVSQIFPRAVVSAFTSDEQLTAMAAEGLRIVLLFFPVVGFQMVTSNFFQSIGMPAKAIFMSLTRQVLFLLPFLFIFPRFFGVNGVWYSMPAADLLASLVAGSMLIAQYRKSKSNLK